MLRVKARQFSTTLLKLSPKFAQPRPFPLPKSDQQDFENLQQKATKEQALRGSHSLYKPKYEEFSGDRNPLTGEIGGPKQDPLRHGDYSFNGKVTDF